MSTLLIVAVIILHASPACASDLHIGPRTIVFAIQSQSLTLDQWFSIITLALAPLATHIAFGISEPVLLSNRRPRLWDRLPHYNPVSIIWRYFAIAYRRLRARCWDRADMAASNALFWDGQQWDGSESILVRSRYWVTRLPEQSHISFLSTSSLATLVTLLQAIQASAKLVTSLDYQHHKEDEIFSAALPYVFFPLAMISLSRLPCALWLTSDYGFQQVDPWNGAQDDIPLVNVETADTASLLPISIESRLYSHTCLRARLFQISWSIIFGLPCCLCLGFLLATLRIVYVALNMVWIVFYITIAIGTLVIIPIQILKGHGGSTVIPCIHAWWYKAFNFLCIFLAILVFVLSTLQTRILPDRIYSSGINSSPMVF